MRSLASKLAKSKPIETVFTPWTALAGGVLIGLASTLLMLFHGRIFGATGILAGLISPTSLGDALWRAMVVVGMATGPIVIFALTGEMPTVQVPTSAPLLILGGLIVGVGVTYGAGCTSGHGVCGMARLSRRSLVATLTFMLFTFISVFVVRHVLGL